MSIVDVHARPPLLIVVFGAAVRPGGVPSPALARRIEGARAAWAACGGRAHLLLTGGVGRHGPAEAVVMARELRARGVPADQLIVEPESRDTLESVRRCASILRGLDLAQTEIRVCTSGFHVPRCRLLMRLAGFPCGAVPVAAGRGRRARLDRAGWAAKEALSLPYDALLMLWHRFHGG